jgi:hypothetical protein
MRDWLLFVGAFGVGLSVIGACSSKGDSKGDEHGRTECAVGSLGCACREDGACDDDLACVPGLKLCANLTVGAGGVFGDGIPDPEAHDDGGAPSDEGGMSSGASTQGGTFSSGGLAEGGRGGTSAGGVGGSINHGGGGSGGTGSNSFPNNPAACALVTTCPTCCDTVGVYALDALATDVTQTRVTSFNATGTAAAAEYSLLASDEIGAIFFRFKTAQSIGSLSVTASGAGGSLEVALVRAGGLDGCIYPVVGSSLSPEPKSCWGLGAGPYAALPADQIEVRVHSTLGGRAALSVSNIQYGP